MLFSIHGLAANALKTPEIAIDRAQANLLATAVAGVAEHYEVLSGVSPAAMAWVNLGQTCAVIYGPKVLLAINRRKRGAQAPQQDELPGGGAAPVGGSFFSGMLNS